MALRMAIAVVARARAGRAGRARRASRSTTRATSPFADRVAAGLEIRWDEARGRLRQPRQGRHGAHEREHAARPRRRGARRPRRARRATTTAPRRIVEAHDPPADARHRAALAGAQPQPLLAQAPRRRRARPRVAGLADRRGARVGVARAPGELALPAAARRGRARASSTRCAHHRQWRFPHALKNQINWNAQLYASAARMTGDGRPAAARLPPPPGALPARRRAGRCAACPRPTSARATASTTARSSAEARPTNFDTPEYSHIVATTLLYHREARAAGMRPLPAADVALLTALDDAPAARQLDARRLPQLGHGARPAAPALGPVLGVEHAGPAHDRDGARSSRRGPSTRAGRRRSSTAGCGSTRAGPTRRASRSRRSSRSTWSPTTATTTSTRAGWRRTPMRAIRLGLGSAPSADPPPFYAYDRELQRLAVSTPWYSTAIVPRTHDAFRYGGIELARLLGPRGAVAATTGGVPPATFGVVVRDAADRVVLASQPGRPRDASLRLEHGRAARARSRRSTAIGHDPRRARARDHDAHASGRRRSTSAGTSAARRRLRGLRRRRAPAHLGRDGDGRAPTRATAALPLSGPGAVPRPARGRRPDRARARRRTRATPSRRCGPGRARCSSRPRAPRPQRTVPHPGPGVAVRHPPGRPADARDARGDARPRGLRD